MFACDLCLCKATQRHYILNHVEVKLVPNSASNSAYKCDVFILIFLANYAHTVLFCFLYYCNTI